jgi:hypothetical protein
MTFEELNFIPHPAAKLPSDIRARVDFANGYGASVIRTSFSYGNEEGLFELALMKDGHLHYDERITTDVLGHLSSEEVTQILQQIEAL